MRLKIFKYVFINVLLICFTNISYAQTYPVYKNSSAIAVLDQDSLFSESEWGKKVLKNVEKKVSKLSDENRSIETALELEESELTKVRKTISKIEFDVLAIKFDEKVKKIRLEQADKQRKINIFLNENRKLFFEKVTPILLDYINELGIEVLLNKDTVALASLGSDITISAINKINEQLKN
jgi:Skp family chaperone for outer membrane proteins